jgi:DNA-3-methyladenine glycosylase
MGRGTWVPPLPPENLDERLPRHFFERPTLEVCHDLIGQYFFSCHDGVVTGGRIVEAEAYCGPEDLGAHTSGGKRTARTEAMHGPKGHAYIYLIYGMYWCVNAVCGPADKPQACLIRALEPVVGMDEMRLRLKARPEAKDWDLCKGPGKLCRALGLNKTHYGEDLGRDRLFLLPGGLTKDEVVGTSPRINIDYAGEYKDLPWRFYVKGNRCVSGPAKWRG